MTTQKWKSPPSKWIYTADGWTPWSYRKKSRHRVVKWQRLNASRHLTTNDAERQGSPMSTENKATTSNSTHESRRGSIQPERTHTTIYSEAQLSALKPSDILRWLECGCSEAQGFLEFADKRGRRIWLESMLSKWIEAGRPVWSEWPETHAFFAHRNAREGGVLYRSCSCVNAPNTEPSNGGDE